MDAKNIRKGTAGERKIAKILSKLNKGKYTVLNNVRINTKDGRAQIDHLVISNFGLFIIETKNFTGVIKGEEDDKLWDKIHYGHSFKFMNPINQNQRHEEALNYIIDQVQGLTRDEILIYPMVVFCNGCKLDIDLEGVMYEKELLSNILSVKQKCITNKTRTQLTNELINLLNYKTR